MAELAPVVLELVKTTLQDNLDRICEIASRCG